MPQFKCEACRARLYQEASPDAVGDLCPGCGSLLEPVGELAEIVGFRSITPRDGTTNGLPGTHEQLGARAEELLARQGSVPADPQLDPERWLDDGGGFSPEALAVALPTPKEQP